MRDWPFTSAMFNPWPLVGPVAGRHETIGWFTPYDARQVASATSERTRFARAMDPQEVRDNQTFNPRMY